MDKILIRDTAFTKGTKMSTINKISLSNLLPELLIYICKYLGHTDLQQLCLVSKQWHDILHFKFTQKSKLVINPWNIATLRKILENYDEYCHRLQYYSMEIHDIESNDDLQPILKLLGSKIRTLHLYKSPVFDILNDYLPSLEVFSIREIPIIGSNVLVSFNLGKFKKLKSLDIKSRTINHDIVSKFMWELTQKNTVKIEKLCVTVLRDQQEDFIKIMQLHSETLKHLELDSWEHIENDLNWNGAFAMLKRLEVIKFSGVYTEVWLIGIIQSIPKNTPLRHFCVEEIFQGNWMELLANKWPGSLISMELVCCYASTDTDIKNLIYLRHSLRNLIIKSSRDISVDGLLQGIASETNTVLRTLVYKCPRHYKNKVIDMQLLIQRVPCLTSLNLKYNMDCVDDTVVSCIFRHLVHLQHLNLDGCPKITDKGLLGFGANPAPITNLKGLQSLSLCHNNEITDKSLIECFKWIELRKLTLNHCHRISSKGIREMVKNCPALEELSLLGCAAIDDYSKRTIAKGFPRLRLLYEIWRRQYYTIHTYIHNWPLHPCVRSIQIAPHW